MKEAVVIHCDRNVHPYDEDTMTNSSVFKNKKQHEPPAKYRSFNDEFMDSIDDIATRGIVPLDPLADDGSVELPDEDRYMAAGPIDPIPVQRREKKEILPKSKASSKEPTTRKKKEPEAFDRVKSFQTMDMTASVAMTEAGGCVNFFDAFFICVEEEEELRKTQSEGSEYSESTTSHQGY
ncbi:unnamed protein product [Cylindrotheca closterium]|uniref:Uncharacterized protein n=1 Tax=Cylindrotheca closterium TaxID=2856 RepID=A0AAD2GBR8_9STRA|nr:unnamed protein product [Cylindrotheca closterium]